MAIHHGPLTFRNGGDTSTVVDPRFGTAATPVQPPGWGGGGGGGGVDLSNDIWVDTDYTGSTDASADINAAIAAAYDLGQTAGVWSATVRLKAGVLRLDNPIMARRRTRLIGSGRRHTILKPFGSASGIRAEAIGAAPDDMEFGHFQIDGTNQAGNSPSPQPKGMYFTNARRVYVHDLWVQKTWATGIGIDFITGVIENCWATDNGRQNAARSPGTFPGCSGIGIGLREVDGTGHQLVITGNHCNGNSNYGIFVESQNGSAIARGVVIVGNTCRDNGQCGIGDSGGLGTIITANTCLDNDQGGVGIDYGTMGVQPGKGLPGVRTQVTGNVLSANAHGVLLESAGPLGLSSPRISCNDISSNDGDGIHAVLAGSGVHENVWADGNTISSNGGDGIRLTGSASVARLAVTDNRIWGNTGAAVTVETPTAGVRVWGNEAWDNTAGVVFDIGKTHTGHRIDTTWVEGASTLPS